MKWSWRIARIAGIGVYVHFTFLFLVAFVVVQAWGDGGGLRRVIEWLAFLVALFAIVVLHELGHALAARRYGIRTRDITLLPIGGVARLERMPEDPWQELVVALAGPAVNVVLAVISLLGLVVLATGSELFGLVGSVGAALQSAVEPSNGSDGLKGLPLAGGVILTQLMVLNLLMVAFNLLPAFPMDGGRVLRALLAMRMDYVRATQTAARIGQGMAVLFVLFAIKNPFLLLIAVFVWLGAASEASSVELRDVLGNLPAREAMITQFQTVAPDEPLKVVMAHIMDGYQRDFPVVSGERVVGMLTRADLLKALAEGGHEQPVSEAMQREFEQAASSELLAGVFRRLQQCRCHSFPVIDRGRLVGVIDMENVGEFIAFRQALRGRGQ